MSNPAQGVVGAANVPLNLEALSFLYRLACSHPAAEYETARRIDAANATLSAALASPRADSDERTAGEIEATQITLGEGLVDITRIDHDGRTGVLFRPRKESIPFGEPGELPEGTYWPVKGDVVLWVSGEGPGVAIKALADLAPDSTRTGQGEAEGLPSLWEPQSPAEWLEKAERHHRKGMNLGVLHEELPRLIAVFEKALAARPAASEAQGAWRPISTAPQTDEDVLVAASYWDEAGTEHRYTTISSYLDQPDRRGFRHRNGAKNATDWMPLPKPTPAPPASSGQGGR